MSVDPDFNQTLDAYGYADENPLDGTDPSGLDTKQECSAMGLPYANGKCGSPAPAPSPAPKKTTTPAKKTTTKVKGTDTVQVLVLGAGVGSATAKSVSAHYDARGETEAQHYNDDYYTDNADAGVLADNAARATALIGAALTAYSDDESGKSAGYTVGDLVGGAAGGAIGGTVGTAVCFGEVDGVGVVCGLVLGAVGSWAGGKLGSAVGNDIEGWIKDAL